MKIDVRTLFYAGGEIPVRIELNQRENIVMVGPGHGRYIKPPLTFWGRFLDFSTCCGRGVLVKPRIEIHFIGDKFIDVETYDVLEGAGIEFVIDGQEPPPIARGLLKEAGLRLVIEEPVTVDLLKKQLGRKNGHKPKFNAEGGIGG